jgi:septum formation protein
MNNKLYLASASKKRKELLQDAGIVFEVVSHGADEQACVWVGDLAKLTSHLAQVKMKAVVLPVPKEHDECFVLTADTLVKHGDEIIGKPRDYHDAVAIIKRVRDGVDCSTGFCIEKRAWHDGMWHQREQFIGSAQGWCSLAIHDDEIDAYFTDLYTYSGFDYLKLAGAFSITGYGAQFLKEVRGSYTAILGLPMDHVRAGLKTLSFFN